MNDNYTLHNSPYMNSNLSYSATNTNEYFHPYLNGIEQYPTDQSMGPYPPSGNPGGLARMSYRPMDPRCIPDRRTPFNCLPKKVREELMYFLDISRCEGGWEDVAERLGFPPNEINHWGAKRGNDSHCAADLLIDKCLKSACCDKTIERFLQVLYEVESWAAYELLLQALPEAVRIHQEETKSSLEVAANAGAARYNPPPADEEGHQDRSHQMPHQQGQRIAGESSYHWEQNFNGFQGNADGFSFNNFKSQLYALEAGSGGSGVNGYDSLQGSEGKYCASGATMSLKEYYSDLKVRPSDPRQDVNGVRGCCDELLLNDEELSHSESQMPVGFLDGSSTTGHRTAGSEDFENQGERVEDEAPEMAESSGGAEGTNNESVMAKSVRSSRDKSANSEVGSKNRDRKSCPSTSSVFSQHIERVDKGGKEGASKDRKIQGLVSPQAAQLSESEMQRCISAESQIQRVPFTIGGRQIHVLLTYCCERPRQMEHVDNLYDCLRKNNFSVSHERNESQKLARDKLGWLDSQFHRADYILVLITPEYARDVSNHINLPQIINRTLPNSQSEKSAPASDQSQNVKRDTPGHDAQITSLNNQSESCSSLPTQCSSLPNKSESSLQLNTLHQSQSTPVIIDPSDRCLNARYIYKLMHMQYFTSNSVNKRYIPVLMPTAIKYSTALKISPRKLIPGWLEHTLVYTWPKDYKDLLYYMMKPDKVLRQFVSSNQPKQVIRVTHS